MKNTSQLFLLVCFVFGLSIRLLNAEEEQSSRSWKSHPVWSPNGKMICFILNQQNDAWKEHHKTLCLMDADGADLKELPETLGILGNNFCWSPSGNEIAFVKKGNSFHDRENIHIVNTNNSTLRNLTSSDDSEGTENHYRQLSWSPNEKQIAFVKNDKIWLINSSGVSRKLTDGDSPSWSPDGKQIAFTSKVISSQNQILIIINIDNGRQYHFKPPKDKHKKKHLPLIGGLSTIYWSPNNDKLFCVSNGHTFSIKTQDNKNHDIMVYSQTLHNCSNLSMSQDRDKLCFSGHNSFCVMDLNLLTPRFVVMPMSEYKNGKASDYKNKMKLRHEALIKYISGEKGDKEPSLSPDGKQIVFTRNWEIYLMNSDGSNQIQLTNERITEKVTQK